MCEFQLISLDCFTLILLSDVKSVIITHSTPNTVPLFITALNAVSLIGLPFGSPIYGVSFGSWLRVGEQCKSLTHYMVM